MVDNDVLVLATPRPQVREKKAYTPFPPQQQPSKLDLAMESGEYFLSEQQKAARARAAAAEKQAAKVEEGKRKREAAFIAPKEDGSGAAAKVARGSEGQADVKQLAASLKAKAKGGGDAAAGGGAKGASAGKGEGAKGVAAFLMPEARGAEGGDAQAEKKRREKEDGGSHKKKKKKSAGSDEE